MTEAARRKPVAKPARRLPVGAPVLWTGLALGTFLAVVALTHGVMLPVVRRLPGRHPHLRPLLAAGVVLAELTRRHHRAVARHGWRHGKRGASPPPGAAASGPGRGCQVAPVADAAHRGPASQVGRTRHACRAGAGRPRRGQ